MFLGLLRTRIDLLLGGGLRAGQLTELVGPSSSGKTQVSNSLGQKLYKLMIAMI
jgi:archaellum biogenesis ATPase FlaH